MQFLSVTVTISYCTERLGTKRSHPKRALASLTTQQRVQ